MSSALSDPTDPVDPIDGSAFDSTSDGDLIERAKGGDAAAFAGLWRRHAAAGRTVARSFTSSLDPDDLVSEAFTRVYQQLQKGKGPTGAFRPYLFTTIRNTASSWGRARQETSIDTLESFEDPETSEQASLDALDHSLTATAFRSLPTRWQEALWYSEVEAMTPQQIGPLLGMSANGVAALCYRAREGLRRSWIQAHLNAADTSPECRFTIERLGSYARAGLGQRDVKRVEEHLDGCAKCTIVAAEAKEVGSRLALVLLPLAAGIGGAAAYTTWLQTGATDVVMAAGMPASVTGGAAGSTAAGAGSVATAASGVGTGIALTSAGVVTAVVGTLALAATVVVAVTLGPTLFPGAPAGPDAVIAAPDGAPGAGIGTDASRVPDVVAPVLPPVERPIAPPPPPVRAPAPDRADESGPGVPPAADPGSVAPVPTPTPTPTPTSTPTPTPEPPTPAPEIHPVDNGGGLYFPTLAGGATPGSVVELYVREVVPADQVPTPMSLSGTDEPGPTEPNLTVEVTESGAWNVRLDMIAPGSYTVTARERNGEEVSTAADPQPFDILPPPQIERFALLLLRVTGIAGAHVEVRSLSLESPWTPMALSEAGEQYWWPSFEGLFTGQVIVARYSDGTSFGPELAYEIPPIFSEQPAASGVN